MWPNSGKDWLYNFFSEALSQHSSIVLSDDVKCAIFYEESSSEEEEEEEVGGDMYPLEDGGRLASATAGEEEMWDWVHTYM